MNVIGSPDPSSKPPSVGNRQYGLSIDYKNTTDHTYPMDDLFHDHFYSVDRDDEPGRASCDVCLIDTPLQTILAPIEFLFKEDSRFSSINRIKVKIDVDHVVSKCCPGDLGRDEEALKRLKKIIEGLPELMRVSRSNAIAFDSVRSLETFLPEECSHMDG